MKNLSRILLILTVVMISIVACDSNKTTKNNSDDRIIVKQGDPTGRVHSRDKIIPLTNIETGEKINNRNVQDFQLVLRAEVDAPEFNGNTLRATHVRIKDNYAYVTYNTEGLEFLGGIDIFDVSDTENPQLITQAYFLNTDVSAVDFDGNDIYLAEHTDIYNDEGFETGAVLEKLSFSGSEITSLDRIDLPSFAATSVMVDGDNVYVTTGNGADGGLTILAKGDLSLLNQNTFEDARFVNVNSEHLVALKGTPAELKTIDPTTFADVNTYSVEGAAIPESKSTFDLVNNMAFVAAGNEGMKVVNLNNGEIIDSIERPVTPEGGVPGDYVTNGVSVNNENLIFVANGAAGIYVANWLDYTTLNVLGSMEFQSSTNFVESKDNVIFVATGFGGLKILEIDYTIPEFDTLGDWDNDGTPGYLVEPGDDIDEEFLEDINAAFPGGNLPSSKPEYFDNVDTNIILEEDAEVWLTFVTETAGWRNTLGYYYYNENNPPESMEDLTHNTVIFPNTSLGTIAPGDKVQLKMRDGSAMFPAGTVIGFILKSNAWNSGEITNGYYSHYSNYEWNTENLNQLAQQNVLLNDSQRERCILSFEDIKLPAGDKDFSDAVFFVTSTPEDAIKTDNLPDIHAE